VFGGAVARVSGSPDSGDTVDIVAADGTWLARAAYSPRSQIAARVWTFDPDEAVDDAFFARRISAAMHRRRGLVPAGDNAYRLIFSESDGLPGVIVDRYADYLVCQFLSAGAERWRETVVQQLGELISGTGIFERSDVAVRRKEGLPSRVGPLMGDAPPPVIETREGDCRYLVDVHQGHKTGFYLDQRENRGRVREEAVGARVLNVFAYSGGFGVAAAVGGAVSVTDIDSSAASLELGARNLALNTCAKVDREVVCGDAFEVLRDLDRANRRFDLIVLDPPKFADSQSDVHRASRGYKDINRLAFKLARPGGRLFTFSCSGHMKVDLFQKIVADAALDARRDAVIRHRLFQAPDHPTALAFPEAGYLKGFDILIQ
jgi:23S rRNA (cytosine1962-C5)-methyltransferase